MIGTNREYVRFYLRGSNKKVRDAHYDGLEEGYNQAKQEIRERIK